MLKQEKVRQYQKVEQPDLLKDQDNSIMRYKRPYMRARKGMETNQRNLGAQNNMMQFEMQMAAQQQMMQQKMMQDLQMQNMLLRDQNELQRTQIEKMDLINSARTTKKQVGPMNSPKKRGGSNSKKRRGTVEIVTTSGPGMSMKHGGSCLPGGRYDKRRMR